MGGMGQCKKWGERERMETNREKHQAKSKQNTPKRITGDKLLPSNNQRCNDMLAVFNFGNFNSATT
jgi:hypothetical protein